MRRRRRRTSFQLRRWSNCLRFPTPRRCRNCGSSLVRTGRPSARMLRPNLPARRRPTDVPGRATDRSSSERSRSELPLQGRRCSSSPTCAPKQQPPTMCAMFAHPRPRPRVTQPFQLPRVQQSPHFPRTRQARRRHPQTNHLLPRKRPSLPRRPMRDRQKLPRRRQPPQHHHRRRNLQLRRKRKPITSRSVDDEKAAHSL